VPAAGVKPTRYGRQLFFLGWGIIVCGCCMPIVMNALMSRVSVETIEALAIFMWLLLSTAVTVIIINFILLARHLLSLLRSHHASMSKAEGLLNGRPAGAPGTLSGATSAAVRQRTLELQNSINRVKWILRLLTMGASTSGTYFVFAFS
jgi:hypothetical protein